MFGEHKFLFLIIMQLKVCRAIVFTPTEICKSLNFIVPDSTAGFSDFWEFLGEQDQYSESTQSPKLLGQTVNAILIQLPTLVAHKNIANTLEFYIQVHIKCTPAQFCLVYPSLIESKHSL